MFLSQSKSTHDEAQKNKDFCDEALWLQERQPRDRLTHAWINHLLCLMQGLGEDGSRLSSIAMIKQNGHVTIKQLQ